MPPSTFAFLSPSRYSKQINMLFATTIGALCITIIALFLVLEGIVRLFFFFKTTFFIQEVRRRDFIATEYHPYLDRVENWSKPMFRYIPIGLRLFNLDNPIPGRVENNSLGFRCAEFTPPDPHVLRIVLLGGSTAWGSGASSNNATIAKQLEIMVNQNKALLGSRQRAECYNLAQINGYQTQDILTLLFFGAQLQPDIVLSLTGWNELVALETMKRELLKTYGVFYMSEMEDWEPLNVVGNKTKHLAHALRLWGLERSAFIRSIHMRKRRKQSSPHPAITESITLGTTLFLRHLTIINTLARAYGARHLQFLQPYLYRKNIRTPSEKSVLHLYNDLRPIHGGKTTGEYLQQQNIYAPLLRDVQKRPQNFGIVEDLCDLFNDEKETMFYTLVHLTDQGYHVVAQRMYNALIKNFTPS